ERRLTGDKDGAAVHVADGAVAELAVVVIAPAIDRSARRQSTRVVHTGAHRVEREPTGHRHGRWAGRGVTVAELAVEVGSPAVAGAAGRHTTGVFEPATENGKGQPAIHGHGRIVYRFRGLLEAVHGAGTEHAIEVRPPAEPGATRGNSARVEEESDADVREGSMRNGSLDVDRVAYCGCSVEIGRASCRER